MNQALYAHMNNKRKKKRIRVTNQPPAGHWWLTPVIPTKFRSGGFQFQASPGKMFARAYLNGMGSQSMKQTHVHSWKWEMKID
jgi:hypothetical protein